MAVVVLVEPEAFHPLGMSAVTPLVMAAIIIPASVVIPASVRTPAGPVIAIVSESRDLIAASRGPGHLGRAEHGKSCRQDDQHAEQSDRTPQRPADDA